MRARGLLLLVFLVSGGFLVSCSSTPQQLLAKHARRGDDYVRQEKYREAVIEYKNAVRAVPGDAAVRWKLAQAALEARDFRIAYEELRAVLSLDPANFEALGKLGDLNVLVGRTEDAGEIADNLVRLRPQDPKGFLLKSALSLRAGRPDEAIGHLKTAVDLDPKAAKPMLSLGNLYFINHDAKTARVWFDRALAADPNLADVHLARGNFFFATGERDEGEKEFRQAIELGKNKEILRIALAEHYAYQGRNEDAFRELEAIVKEMNSQKARKVLAELRIESGKIAEAKTIVNGILKENDKDLDGKYLKGRIALAEKRLNDARVLFGEVVKQDAVMARARLYNGLTGIFLGHIEEGKKEIREAVRLDPGNVKARLLLGDLHLKSNAPDAAEKEAGEVLRRDPANVLASVLLADSFLLRREYGRAEQVYGTIIKLLPRSPVGYYKMGISRKLQGKPAEAASYFGQAVARAPKDLASVNEYVFALAAARQGDRAEKVLDGYLEKSPNESLLWEMAGRLQLAVHRSDRAEAAFLKAVDLAPARMQPYYELGILYASQGRLPESEIRLRTGLEKNERSAGGHLLLGVVLNMQGKIEDANRQYRRVLELEPENPLAANNLASNLCDRGGNLDEALKFAQIAREAEPEDPHIADTLGWIYCKKGFVDTALPLIEDACRELGGNPSVRYHRGVALAGKGRAKEARAEFQAALAHGGKFPETDDARKALKSLKPGGGQ